MSDSISQLQAGDYDETIRFLDAVFAEHRPHDFANLLPVIYQPTDEHMRCNYAVRESGRLAAVVGVFPINLCVGGVTLKVAGIGGVAVHPDSRGKGYMNLLMSHAVAEMRGAGYDLSYLGGRRQRYAYFGYEVAGCKYKLTFSRDNVRHALKDCPPVSFEPAGEDLDTMARLKTLHDAQDSYCARPAETFNRYLKNWHYQPMIARGPSGEIAGYLVVDKDGSQINELVAKNEDTAAGMIGAWVQRSEVNVTLEMQGLTGPVLRRLAGFAETTTLAPSGNWQVFNWQRVVDALMRVKHARDPMPYGSVALGITDQPRVLSLTVDASGARCDLSDGPADLSVDPLSAVPLLFGPMPPSVTMPLPPAARMLLAWCPLPLGISPQDKV